MVLPVACLCLCLSVCLCLCLCLPLFLSLSLSLTLSLPLSQFGFNVDVGACFCARGIVYMSMCSRVCACVQGSKYRGTIQRVDEAGSVYAVKFDDGDFDAAVPRDHVELASARKESKKPPNMNISIGDDLNVAEAKGAGTSDSSCASGNTHDIIQVMSRNENIIIHRMYISMYTYIHTYCVYACMCICLCAL